jgi:hypothetical protein
MERIERVKALTLPSLGGYSVNSCYYSFFNNGFVMNNIDNESDDTFDMVDDATDSTLITGAQLFDQNSLYPSSCQERYLLENNKAGYMPTSCES